MPTINVTISSLGAANANNCRSATYAEGSGVPDWADVASNGDINVSRNPNANTPDVDITWTLPSGFVFAGTDPVTFDPPSTDFTYDSGAGTATVKVTDSNNDATVGSEHPYQLHLGDGTSLDPKVINR